jgi:hypothetical protein
MALYRTGKDEDGKDIPYDIVVIDTEGYEALLATDDIPTGQDKDVASKFDRLEDRVRSMLGVIISMSDVVLFLCKSNAIDRTDFQYIE